MRVNDTCKVGATLAVRVELERFRVIPGKEARAREWMDTLRNRIEECRATLQSERMFIESIFSEEADGAMYLYWYSIQGEGGAGIEQSEHEVDKVHSSFWQECIDPSYRAMLTSELLLVPDVIQQAMV